MSDASTNIALFGLIGALVGAIPGILGVLFNWLKSRDTVSRSMKRMELAKAEVDFISAWLKTVSTLADDESLMSLQNTARTRLDRLMQITEQEVEVKTEESIEAKESPKKIKRSLWFYIYTGFFFFMLLGASINDQGNVSFEQLKNELSGDGGIALIVFGIPWVILFVRYLLSLRKNR